MTQQLIKKNRTGGYDRVMPKSWTAAISDKETGAKLVDMLQAFNMYFLSFTGNKKTTRKQVPDTLRRKGLWITYVSYDNKVVTEWYNSDKIDNESWEDSRNWNIGSNSLIGDISMTSDGYWVVNGEVTNIEAKGEKGESPILRADIESGYIQYSYDNEYWYNLVALSYITPNISLLEVNELSAESAPRVTNEGNEYDVKLRFSLPKSPDIRVGSTATAAAGANAKVTNSGTDKHVVLDFTIPRGVQGAPGQKGDGWQLKGFVDNVSQLPSSGTVGDLYLVGTTEPYNAYVYKNNTSKFVNIGNSLEVKAGIFDGGRADTQYGGARVINCGGADAYLTY